MRKTVLAVGLFIVTARVTAAQPPARLLGAPCTASATEQVTEPKTGRTYLLDYPCDLKSGERVTFILNLHGGGSSGTWQRRYFPVFDQKEQHRLVIASPYSPTRSWSENDDPYLQNIVTAIVDQVGRANVQAFWLAGHSQGGATSRRLVCTDFFRNRVDGFLSLSGGRLGGAPQRAPNAGRPAQAGATAAARGAAPAAGRGAAPQAAEPMCEFSHIYSTGQHEIVALPTTSARAAQYSCGARVRREDVVDTKAGYVHDGGNQNPGTKEWGLLPRPGRAEVFVYPNCTNGEVVADVVRADKGHTEGLEPRVTEELVKLMLSARGGKLQTGG
jgi:pimeloyl-ACP methyl ester carboxylesterase